MNCHSLDLRRSQKYAYIPELLTRTGVAMAEIDGENDHLGAFLVRELLKLPINSAAHSKVEIVHGD